MRSGRGTVNRQIDVPEDASTQMEVGMGQVTTSDIARQASVSRVTVSRVLNNRGPFTEEVRRRVLHAASELGYPGIKGYRHNLDRDDATPAMKAVGDIGFFYSSLLPSSSAYSNPYWSPILRGVEREAQKAGVQVVYRELASEPESALQTAVTALRRMRLSGILLVGSAEIDLVRQLRQYKVPLVLVDMHFPEIPGDSVVVDNAGGITQCTQHLLERGHRRIAYISGPATFTRSPYPRAMSQIFSLQARLAQYFVSLLEADIPIDYDLVQTGALSFEGGYQAARALVENRRRFTAILGANDETAIGAMKAVQECGLRVPDDISVIGFDDIDSARHVTPSLTSIDTSKESMGAVAVRTLFSRVLDPDASGATTLMNVHLVDRQSVGRLN